MNTYLFVVDPNQYDASVVDEKDGGRWSSCKDTTVGDRVLVYVSRGNGISYEWAVTAPAEKDPKWRFMCGVRRMREFVPPIGIQEIKAAVPRELWAAPYTNFRGFRALRIPDKALEAILALRPKNQYA